MNKVEALEEMLREYNASVACAKSALGGEIEEMATLFEDWLCIAMGTEPGSLLHELALEKLRVMLVDFRSLMNALSAAPADKERLKNVLLNKLPKAAGSTEQCVELYGVAPSDDIIAKALDFANSFPKTMELYKLLPSEKVLLKAAGLVANDFAKMARIIEKMPPDSKKLERALKSAIFGVTATFDAFKASYDVAPPSLKELLLLKMSDVAATPAELGIIADIAEPGSDAQKNAIAKKAELEEAEAKAKSEAEGAETKTET